MDETIIKSTNENRENIANENLRRKYGFIEGTLIGGALFSLASMFIGGAIYSAHKISLASIELEKARVQRGYVLQEKDLNNNGIPEKFYEVNGQKYFLEIDGQKLEAKLSDN